MRAMFRRLARTTTRRRSFRRKVDCRLRRMDRAPARTHGRLPGHSLARVRQRAPGVARVRCSLKERLEVVVAPLSMGPSWERDAQASNHAVPGICALVPRGVEFWNFYLYGWLAPSEFARSPMGQMRLRKAPRLTGSAICKIGERCWVAMRGCAFAGICQCRLYFAQQAPVLHAPGLHNCPHCGHSDNE